MKSMYYSTPHSPHHTQSTGSSVDLDGAAEQDMGKWPSLDSLYNNTKKDIKDGVTKYVNKALLTMEADGH